MEQAGKGRVGLIDAHVGMKLRDRRILLGLNQYELGEAVDVSIQQIQKYESAKNRISSAKLYSFAKLLKVPISYFFEGIVTPSSDAGVTDNNAFAEEQTEFVRDEARGVLDKEIMSLVKAYKKIDNESKRKGIFDLVRALAHSSD